MKNFKDVASFQYEPYEKYVLYNFHRKDWLDEVVHNITTQRRHPIVILSGETGTGRHYFIESAAFKASKEFHKTDCFCIDLEGSEEDGSGIDEFIRHQTEKCSAKQNPETSENLKKSFEDSRQYIPKSWPTFAGAFFISLCSNLFAENDPIKKNIIDVSAQKQLFTKEPEDALSSFLDILTENRHLIIIINHLESNLVLNRWLRDEVNRNKKLTLVIKCAANDATGDIMPRIESYAKRFEFLPHSLKSFKKIIDSAWNPNKFPDELYAALWKKYRSSLKGLVCFMRKLVQESIIIQDQKKNWRLSDDGLESERCAEIFSRGFYSPISEFIDSQENGQSRLERFLFLAALCGENVPLDLILDYMKLDGEERDELIEIIDDHLVFNDDADQSSANAGILLFRDNGYNHPSFPDDMLTYSFITPLDYVSIIAHHPDLENLKNTASSLFFFFKKRLHVMSKGIAVLYIHLFDHSRDNDLREKYASLLSWWVGMDGAERLSEQLVEQMKDGLLSPDIVWSVFETTKNTWPPYRRKALLDAYEKQPDGIPVDRFESFHYEKSWILFQLAEYDEALAIAKMLHDHFETDGRHHDPSMGRVCNIIGIILTDRAEFNDAMIYFKKALNICLAIYGENHTHTATVYHGMGNVFANQNRLDDALIHFEKALDIYLAIYGENHPRTALEHHGMGNIFANQNRLDDALIHFEKALNSCLSIYGENHPDTAGAYHGMGRIFDKQNRLDDALIHYEKALDIYLAIYGENHPDTAAEYHGIGCIFAVQSKFDEGLKYLGKAVKITEQMLGDHHPKTQLFKKNLNAVKKMKTDHSKNSKEQRNTPCDPKQQKNRRT